MGPDLFVILASKRSYRCLSRKLRTVSEGLRNSNAFMHRPLRVASRYSRNPHRGFTNTTYRYCSIAIRNTGLYLLDKRSGGRQEPKGDSGQYVKKEGNARYWCWSHACQSYRVFVRHSLGLGKQACNSRGGVSCGGSSPETITRRTGCLRLS